MDTNTNCQHKKTTIVVLSAFAAVEVIGYKCTKCGKIIKTVKQ